MKKQISKSCFGLLVTIFVSNRKHFDARLNELRNLLNEWFEKGGGLK